MPEHSHLPRRRLASSPAPRRARRVERLIGSNHSSSSSPIPNGTPNPAQSPCPALAELPRDDPQGKQKKSPSRDRDVLLSGLEKGV
jgi:hypothetical protein